MFEVLAAAACLAGADTPAEPLLPLDAGERRGTLVLHYRYQASGLEGSSDQVIDLETGSYVERTNAGGIPGAEGYDGRRPWMMDLSGFHSPQEGGNKPALAVTRAYLNARLWLARGKGNAKVRNLGCGTAEVTPVGGEPFSARFDPNTHRLLEITQRSSFGAVVRRQFSDYQLCEGAYIPGKIVSQAEGSGDEEIQLLTKCEGERPRGASSYAMPKQQPHDWNLPASGRVTMPFRLMNNHVFVDVKVNGSGPFPFIVDTGGHDILTPQTMASLKLGSFGSATSAGAGEKLATNGYAKIASLEASGAVLRQPTVVTLDFSPPEVEGLQIAGMLGVEFLERFVVTFDYGARTLTLEDPARFDPARRDLGTPVPFKLYEHMPQVDGSLDGRRARFNIDTGSRVEVTLTEPFVERAGLRSAYSGGVTVTDGWGVGGPSRSYVVRAGELKLGSMVVNRPVASLSTAKHGAFSDPYYEGNIGSGLLKRFTATFDYSRRVLYLRPLDRPDPDTGRFDRSGMWINQAPDGFLITDVAANGPAAQAGLATGDVILALGDRSASAMTLSDARRALKLMPVGTPLDVRYRRSGAIASARIRPADQIPD